MKDVYQIVTDKLVAMVDDAGEWSPPWRRTGKLPQMPVNYVSRHRYRGINIFLLWATAMEHGWSHEWATIHQWNAKGGKVRKFEKGTPVIFFKEYVKELADGQEERLVIRQTYAFNRSQIDGIAQPEPEPNATSAGEAGPLEHIDAIDQLVIRTGADLHHTSGGRACYVPAFDRILLPPPKDFRSMPHYYGTLFHELVHWTSADDRCQRRLGKRFGDAAYAAEELLAEMGAAFLAADYGIDNVIRDENAAYLAAWLKLAKEDKRALITAASLASQAADYLHQCGQEPGLLDLQEEAMA